MNHLSDNYVDKHRMRPKADIHLFVLDLKNSKTIMNIIAKLKGVNLLMEKHVCPWWLAYAFDNPLRRIFHNSEKIFTPYLNEGMTAIGIGCGMGYFSIGMAKIVGKTGKIEPEITD